MGLPFLYGLCAGFGCLFEELGEGCRSKAASRAGEGAASPYPLSIKKDRAAKAGRSLSNCLKTKRLPTQGEKAADGFGKGDFLDGLLYVLPLGGH